MCFGSVSGEILRLVVPKSRVFVCKHVTAFSLPFLWFHSFVSSYAVLNDVEKSSVPLTNHKKLCPTSTEAGGGGRKSLQWSLAGQAENELFRPETQG